jgi:hypothetical protein
MEGAETVLPAKSGVLLCELAEVGHESIDGILHMKMPNGNPDEIRVVQLRNLLLFSADCVFVRISEQS